MKPVEDRHSSQGQIILGGCSHSATPLHMRCDNLKIWDISNLAMPSTEVVPAPAGQCCIAYKGDGDTYIRHCDGSGVPQLTAHPANEGGLTWPTDGQRAIGMAPLERVRPNAPY